MANLSNINNKFIVTDGGHVSIGATTTTYPLTVESGGVGTVLRAGTSFVSIDSVGSAASPSLIFNGDSNTGIWRPASDTLGFSTAGVERFKIGTSNALLIGTSYQLKFTTDDGSTQLGKLFEDVGFTVEGKINNNLNLRSLANTTQEGIKFQNKTGGVLSTHMFIEKAGNITIGNGDTGLTFGKLVLRGDPYVITDSGQARSFIDCSSNINPGAGLYTGAISFGGASTGRAAISGVQSPSGSDGDRQGLAFFTHGSGTGSADAAEAMRIQSDGNVGIGTDSPGSKLHVVDGNNYAKLGDLHGNSTMSLRMADNSGFPVEVQAYGTELRFNTATTTGATPSVKMNILPNGNVGIGTTSPDYLLDLSKTAVSVDTYSGINLQASNYGYTIEGGLTQNVGGELIFSSNNAGTRNPRVKFAANGNVGIGTDSPAQPLSVHGNFLVRTTNADGNKNRMQCIVGGSSDAANLYLYYGNSGDGTVSVRINAQGNSYFNGGNVGIGITSPQDKLHVNGDAIISSTRHGDYATASLGTAGVAVAAISASTNGQSAIVEFVASGNNGAYYNVVYSCYNGGGYWYYTKNVVGSGGNIEVAETNGAGSSTLVFYFRTTSGTASYTPRVMMKGMPYNLVTF